tara:strand:+ start:72 stop:413 length:342 start_codon:yes stop_codon:yes gene_type:complete
MKKSVIILIIFLFGFANAEQDTSKVINNDPWIAYDKFLHFSVSASIVLSTQYTFEQKMNYKTQDAMNLSVFIAIVSGIFKELWDKSQPNGFFSKRDIVANVAGIALGVFIIKL